MEYVIHKNIIYLHLYYVKNTHIYALHNIYITYNMTVMQNIYVHKISKLICKNENCV